MKTYCWKCEKQTVIEKPVQSERNKMVVRGFCGVCGVITSKTRTIEMKSEEQITT